VDRVQLQGLMTGLACGAGAVVAHSLAGGQVDLSTATLAVVVPVFLARFIAGSRLTWYGAGLVAAVAQATLHLVFVSSCASTAGCLLSPGEMAMAHLLAAAFSVFCALGGERAVIRAISIAAASLGIPSLQLPAIPTPEQREISVWAAPLRAQWWAQVSPARGPPAC